MMRFATPLAVVAAVVLSAITVVAGQQQSAPAAQQPGSEEVATFRAVGEVVSVSVTVTDKDGKFITDLTQKDFVVLEDGKQQKVVNFRGLNDEFPVGIGLGLVLDISGSMSVDRLDTMRTVVQQLLEKRLKEEDEVYLMEFAGQSRLRLPFTTEHNEVLNEIRKFRNQAGTRIGTAIYDAIRDALPISSKGKFKKQVILLVTDGGDTSSTTNRAQLAQLAAASDVLIYAIVVDGEEGVRSSGFQGQAGARLRQSAAELREITNATGGETVYVQGFQQFEKIMDKLGEDFTQQYFVEYERAGEKDGKEHVVQVGVARKDVLVRNRTTYKAD